MRHNKHHASLGVTRRASPGDAVQSRGRADHARPHRDHADEGEGPSPVHRDGSSPRRRRPRRRSEKKDALHLRRLALSDLRDETAVTLLFNENYKEFANRSGGYTRIYKLGQQRLGDAAEMALIEFVKAEDVGYSKSKGRKSGKGRKAKATPAAAATTEAPAQPAAVPEEAPKPEQK